MQYDQFVGQVQDRAQLASKGQAVTVIRATLETLADHMAGGAPHNLASQLPREIGEYLLKERQSGFGAEKLSLAEFFLRVSEREHTDLPTATWHAAVVMEVLRDAVTPGEYEKFQSQFPPSYVGLFEPGRVSATRGQD